VFEAKHGYADYDERKKRSLERTNAELALLSLTSDDLSDEGIEIATSKTGHYRQGLPP
jgi:hypothetical protein